MHFDWTVVCGQPLLKTELDIEISASEIEEVAWDHGSTVFSGVYGVIFQSKPSDALLEPNIESSFILLLFFSL